MSETFSLDKAPCYPQVNKAFQDTCKILFGEPVGELKDFDDYLSRVLDPFKAEKSMISGKELLTSHYLPGPKFISQDETDLFKPPLLDVNSIKDIDSLLEAVKEVFVYSGNRFFGTNSNVWLADSLTDCHYVLKAKNVILMKYASHVHQLRECSYAFGIVANPWSQHIIKCTMGGQVQRGFESYSCSNSSDIYYCFKCDDSTDCLFSFGLKGKSCAIGNNLLPREKYLELKKKLVSEIAEELKSKKKIAPLLELPQAFGFAGERKDEETVSLSPAPKPIEDAFAKTTKLVLGEQLSPISKYDAWLQGINTYGFKKVKGALGSVAKQTKGGFSFVTNSRLVDEPGFYQIAARLKLEKPEARLNDLMRELAKKIPFTCAFTIMPSSGLVDVPFAIRSNDVYAGLAVESKLVAYSVGVKSSYIFGGLDRVIGSNFLVNCYDSVGLSRCLEVDCSFSTADSLFCHNCENVSNALFSFNARGKSNLVANNEVGKANFEKSKKIVLDYVLDRLRRGEKLEELHLFSVPKWR